MSRVLEGGGRAVFKVGYRALRGEGRGADPALKVVADLWTPDSRFVVVHGGGDPVTEQQRQLGIQVQRAPDGQRITDEQTLQEAAIPVFTQINRAVAAQLEASGVDKTHSFTALHRANTVLYAERNRRLGLVAEQPVVNNDLLEGIQDLGFLSVVSPLSRDMRDTGQILNTNGDKAAAAFPGSAFFITDREGVLDREGSVIDVLTQDRAEELIAGRVIKDGMVVKVRSALTAAESRQNAESDDRVFITNTQGAKAIFEGESAGTVVVMEK